MSSVGSRLLLEWKEVAFPSLMPPENIYPTYGTKMSNIHFTNNFNNKHKF